MLPCLNVSFTLWLLLTVSFWNFHGVTLWECDCRMSGLQAQERACSLSQPSKDVAAAETKPKKRICCACPDTKKLRDECIVENGESACTKWIEAHRMCLRSEGFKVWELFKDKCHGVRKWLVTIDCWFCFSELTQQVM